MGLNPKPGVPPCPWDELKPTPTTILLLDLYLRRQDVIDRIDDLADSDIQAIETGKHLSKLDIAKLYVEISGEDVDPRLVVEGRQKGEVIQLLADAVGFHAAVEQQEVVKEQAIQVLLYFQTGDTADRMPSLPHSSHVDLDLEAQRKRERKRRSPGPIHTIAD